MIIINGRSLSERGTSMHAASMCVCVNLLGNWEFYFKKKTKNKTRFMFTPWDKESFKKTTTDKKKKYAHAFN